MYPSTPIISFRISIAHLINTQKSPVYRKQYISITKKKEQRKERLNGYAKACDNLI